MYCLAVSTTSDATGSYNRYAFSFPAGALPDYPKLGIWPDAYYATFNIFFASKFIGAMACAYDRTNMLAGDPASAVCFSGALERLQPAAVGPGRETPPPAGSPNFVVGVADASDLQLFQFHVDFANPLNSSLTGPTPISVAPFSEICNRSINLACIPEPSPGEKVDAISDRAMYRLAYRNFGDHESLVVNHTVAGGPLAGVRWYEIRSPGASPFVFQQGTVVDPAISFWMGSIAMDKVGNMALGFSASSRTVDPSILLVGRTPSDLLGVMEAPITVVDGTGVQLHSFIAGVITAAWRSTPRMTAPFGTRRSTTKRPAALTGRHASCRSSSNRATEAGHCANQKILPCDPAPRWPAWAGSPGSRPL
jgi:hypothetical protein